MQPSTSTAFDTPTGSTKSIAGELTSYASSSPQSKPNSFTAINRSSIMESSTSKTMSMSSLISPPEATPYESFSRSSPPTMAQTTDSYQKFNQFPSPPVSPEQKISGPEEVTSPNVKDPILYPNQDLSTTSTQPPLFADAEEDVTQRMVDEHMAARAQHQFREASPPPREDYFLVLEFKSQVAKLASQNTRKWYIREREFLLEDQRRQSAHKHLPKIAPAPRNNVSPANRVVKPAVPRPRTVAAPRKPRAEKIRNFGSETPDREIKRQHAGTTTREDRDFNALPDFSPSISTLPNRPNSLKVEWKGAPIDLRNDPFRHLMHEDEVALAANLRLDCATYLTSKRRIFIARIECLKIGKEFRKTDSQQACKIDVNKASKLWTAFEKVGWLRKEHFIKFL